MSKVTLGNLSNLQNDTTATNTINANTAVISNAIDNTISRDGTSPNQMNAPLDMNSQQIINLPSPATNNSPLRLTDLNKFVGGGTIANIPAGGTTNQVLSKLSSADYNIGWQSAAVTSVGLAMPAEFTVSNSPITSAGTLTAGWVTPTTGSGGVVKATSPTLVTPLLGTPTSGVLTNCTGTAAGLTAGTVTTNANLTGPITSTGNATAVGAQTGTGNTFVMQATPTLTTPVLGVATATSINKMAITAPATSSTLAVADGKTATVNNTLTFSGTDASTLNIGVGGTITGSSSAAIYYDNIPQNSKSTAYTTVLSDAQKHILHPAADTTARTWTIDSNANVAYPIGTTITFVNQNAAGSITLTITTDTMRLAGAGTTGARVLAANGIATALKITSTEWIISGTGLT
jgi:hypothetical protein